MPTSGKYELRRELLEEYIWMIIAEKKYNELNA